jgi:hypothetical protein
MRSAASLTGKVDGEYSYLSALKGSLLFSNLFLAVFKKCCSLHSLYYQTTLSKSFSVLLHLAQICLQIGPYKYLAKFHS